MAAENEDFEVPAARLAELIEAAAGSALVEVLRRETRLTELATAFRSGRLPVIEADDIPLLLRSVVDLQDTVEALTLGDPVRDPGEVRDVVVGAAVVSVLGAIAAGALAGAGRLTYRRWRR